MKAIKNATAVKKPAAKPATQKKLGAKSVSGTKPGSVTLVGAKFKPGKKLAVKLTGKNVSGTKPGSVPSAGFKGKTGKSAAKLGAGRRTAFKSVPQLLPILPPTFEPIHRSAEQLRAAVEAALV